MAKIDLGYRYKGCEKKIQVVIERSDTVLTFMISNNILNLLNTIIDSGCELKIPETIISKPHDWSLPDVDEVLPLINNLKITSFENGQKSHKAGGDDYFWDETVIYHKSNSQYLLSLLRDALKKRWVNFTEREGYFILKYNEVSAYSAFQGRVEKSEEEQSKDRNTVIDYLKVDMANIYNPILHFADKLSFCFK